MKISAVLWVKDESDLLAAAVLQLLRSGVATVTIFDDQSRDETQAVINELCAVRSDVFRGEFSQNLLRDLSMDGPVFAPVIARDNPDWLLVSDPDEFWVHKSGDLRNTRALKSHDIVFVERFNAALTDDELDNARFETEGALRDIALLTDRVNMNLQMMDQNPDLRWVQHRINPKLMIRPDKCKAFGLGMHQVATVEGSELKRARGQDIVIAHLPFTTFSRFERKVQNIAGVFARFNAEHSGNKAWHWRRWLDIYQRGKLRGEFDRQFFSPEEISALVSTGGVKTIPEIFEERRIEAAARKVQRANA